MSETLLFQTTHKSPISLFLAQPITPKKLSMFCRSQINTPTATHYLPYCEKIQTLNPNDKPPKPKRAKNPNKSLRIPSPVPEFAKEFMYNTNLLTCPRKAIESKANFHPSAPPSCKNLEKSLSKPICKSNARSKSNLSISENKEPTLHKILRLFKPQISKFREKTHIQVFTTVSPAVKKSKAKLKRSLEILNKVHRKKRRPMKEFSIEVCEQVETGFNEYNRPALTYGEKLWKLNEISVLNFSG